MFRASKKCRDIASWDVGRDGAVRRWRFSGRHETRQVARDELHTLLTASLYAVTRWCHCGRLVCRDSWSRTTQKLQQHSPCRAWGHPGHSIPCFGVKGGGGGGAGGGGGGRGGAARGG